MAATASRPRVRNLAREQAEHAATLAARYTARLQELRTGVPHLDRALIGRQAIQRYVYDLGIRRLNFHPVSWRMLRNWRLHRHFPMIPGSLVLSTRRRSPAMSTTHCIAAWLMCQPPLPAFFSLRLDDEPLTGLSSTTSRSRPAHRAA